MLVNNLMHSNAELATPDTTLLEIACKMRDADVGAIPIGDNDRLVGMITDRDIAIRAVADGLDMTTARAQDILSDKVVWCYDDVDATEAASIMTRGGVRRLPVVNRDKRLVGMISVGDLTRESPELAGDTLKTLSAVNG